MRAATATALRATALFLLSGCAHVAPSFSSQLQSFGAAMTISASSSSAARDTLADRQAASVCVSERCVHVPSRHERKRSVRIQLSFYAPSLTEDPFRR